MPPKANRSPKDSQSSNLVLAGRHAVADALRRHEPLTKILVQKGLEKKGPLAEIVRLAHSAGIPCQEVPLQALNRSFPGASHQGVVAFAGAMSYADFDDQLVRWAGTDAPALVALLDGVTDPRNLGAILRSAAAWQVDLVVIPQHRSAGVTPATAKAAAGTLGLVPVARVTNLSAAIARLKEVGFWVVAADPRGERTLSDWDFSGRAAVVLGGEGRGVGRLVRERCDASLRIPMAAGVESLNVAVAAGLLFYEAFRQRTRVRKV